MQKGQSIQCPSCGGKGHVFDPMSLFILIWGWIAFFFERNNPKGMTRKKCPQCGGEGFIKVP